MTGMTGATGGTMAYRSAAVICTRRRPPMVADAVRAILAGSPGPDHVIVVDQSAGGQGIPPAEFQHEPRVVWYAHSGVGLSRGRNVGMAIAEAAGAHVVAFTDDDCVPQAGWIAHFTAVLEQSQEVGLTYGSTKPASHDGEQGCIPASIVRRSARHRGIASKGAIEGMGACMAVRVDAWRAIGGFDDWLGAGTDLASAEDNDFCIRMLLAGFVVAETPLAAVIHHGFRSHGELDHLIAGYMRGSGAVMAKSLRLGGALALPCLAAASVRWIRGTFGVDLPVSPRRGPRLQAFWEGFRTGLTSPIERRSGRFLPYRGADDLVARTEFTRRELHRVHSGGVDG